MDAIIEAEGLVKAFGNRVRALDGLTLTVQRGSIYGLLGPNGAGKTTLIRILATLLPPDAGTARIAGIDIRTNPAGVRAQIGLAGQSAAVDDYLTGRENVEMVGRLYGLPHGRRGGRAPQEATGRLGRPDPRGRRRHRPELPPLPGHGRTPAPPPGTEKPMRATLNPS
jgi:ABC-2 type transport system ATP-binding protein